jgi:hypothetical protein
MLDYTQKKVDIVQKKSSEQNEKTTQRKSVSAVDYLKPVQRKSVNNTGLPDNIKNGTENFSGVSLDDVKVHYNSSKPAQMKALAYTQGTDIHVAPGQEKHLGHEAWHVVQQKQGRVAPTTQMKGVNVNDNTALEHEADIMGAKVSQMKSVHTSPVQKKNAHNSTIQCRKSNGNVVQMVPDDAKFGFWQRKKRIIARALFKKHPGYVYRVDDRSPEEIKKAGGFMPRNMESESTLLEHILGNDLNNSAHGTRGANGLNTSFVSTASAKAFIDIGQPFGGLWSGERYLYKISTEGGNFTDVLDYLDREGGQDAESARIAFKYQREWASKGGIPYDKIIKFIDKKVYPDFLVEALRGKNKAKTEQDVDNIFESFANVMP